MRRISLASLFAACIGAGLLAQSQYLASEQITVAASPIGFTASKISPSGKPQAVTANCRLETAEIRWTIDSTVTVSSTVGTLLEVGDYLSLSGHETLVNFSAIRTGATSGQLDCTYSTP